MEVLICFMSGNYGGDANKDDNYSSSPGRTPTHDRQTKDKGSRDPKKSVKPSNPAALGNHSQTAGQISGANYQGNSSKTGMKQENTASAYPGQTGVHSTFPSVQLPGASTQHGNPAAAVHLVKKDQKKVSSRDYPDSRGQDKGDRGDRDSGWDTNRESRDNYRDSKYESRGTKKYNSKKRSSSSTSRGKRRDEKSYLDKRVG